MNATGLTPELIEHIKQEEGWVDHPYLCPAGYPTIGWGHRIESMDHPKISIAQGMEYLNDDLLKARDIALRLSPGLKVEPERRLAAIIDFVYNLGGGAYAGSTLRQKVNGKQWAQASMQMKRWVYARNPKTERKEIHAGLARRRAKTAKWLLDG